ncbi:MAG: amidase, partial [Candidatus Levybacteria bacterium]|nr:amidase [Candidatus Levybacteria bacterium]
MKLNELTIKEATEGLSSKKFSCLELTEDCLERIKEVDGKLNSFITVTKDKAIEQAKEQDKLIAASSSEIFNEKPLLGIPIAHKDMFSTKGIKTTAGSKIIENYIPPFDATVVRKLKNAGAIIVGKTNQDAWGHGSSGENSDFGPTKNPYDLSRVPGGSSSGSAVAVATRESLMATGTDTGSSVRLAAAFCNVVGLKPTYGRVSRYGIIAMASSFDTVGHITKTVYDNALVLEITAGKDIHDATTATHEVPKYTKSFGKKIEGLTIGIRKEYFVEGMEKSVKD